MCEGLDPFLSKFSLHPVWSGVGTGPQSGSSCLPTVEAALELRASPRAHHPGTVSPVALEGVALPVAGGAPECTHPSAAPQCEQDDVWGSQDHGRDTATVYLGTPSSEKECVYSTTAQAI